MSPLQRAIYFNVPQFKIGFLFRWQHHILGPKLYNQLDRIEANVSIRSVSLLEVCDIEPKAEARRHFL